jgi:hypothetical protein
MQYANFPLSRSLFQHHGHILICPTEGEEKVFSSLCLVKDRPSPNVLLRRYLRAQGNLGKDHADPLVLQVGILHITSLTGTSPGSALMLVPGIKEGVRPQLSSTWTAGREL